MNANSKALQTKGTAAHTAKALTSSKVGVLAQLVQPNNVTTTPEPKQLLYGTPTYPVKDGWFVSIGRKYDAFCPNNQFGDAEIGKRSLFIVDSVRELEDVAIISRNKAQHWDELLDRQRREEVFFVKVVKTGLTNDGNSWTSVEFVEGRCKGRTAFIPARHMHGRNAAEFENKLIPVTVAKLDPKDGSKSGLIHLNYEHKGRRNSDAALSAFKDGEYVEGRVLRFISAQKNDTHPSVIVLLRRYGLSVEAMVHKTEVAEYPEQTADELMCVGDTIKVQIMRRSDGNKSFALSMRSEERAKFLANVEPGDVLGVTVTRPCKFGYFVDLGNSIEMMIRTNQLAHKDGGYETLTVGSEIKVVVFKFDKETGKMVLNRGHLKAELR
jgi:ribosomal protein S1